MILKQIIFPPQMGAKRQSISKTLFPPFFFAYAIKNTGAIKKGVRFVVLLSYYHDSKDRHAILLLNISNYSHKMLLLFLLSVLGL